MFPFFDWVDKCFAVVYDLPHLGLKGFFGVGFRGQEVVGFMNCSTSFSYCSVGSITSEFLCLPG